MSDVTQILQQIESGVPSAVKELLPLVSEFGESHHSRSLLNRSTIE